MIQWQVRARHALAPGPDNLPRWVESSAREHPSVQRNAAGSLRVSLNSSFLLPPRVGARGLKTGSVPTSTEVRARDGRHSAPCVTGFRGHDGAWPSEDRHRMRGNDRTSAAECRLDYDFSVRWTWISRCSTVTKASAVMMPSMMGMARSTPLAEHEPD